jgi:phosphatidylglycerophosphate synthase
VNVWRARLQRWLGPIAARCPLSPNAISLIALALNLIAAVCFYFADDDPRLYFVAVALLIVGGLADAFDGIVARVQSKESRYGDFLDHAADRISDLFVAAGWLIGNHVRPELIVLALIAAMLNGYLGTQVEATWGKRSYEEVGRGEFVIGMIVFPIISYIIANNGWLDVRFAGFAIAEWMTCLLLLFAVVGIVQRFALASRMEKS